MDGDLKDAPAQQNFVERIAAAKAAGYSDQEITERLRSGLAPKVAQALQAGYKPEEVRDHLTSTGLPEDVAFDLTASTPERISRFAGKAWEKVKGVAQPAARLLTMPGRGVRGITVGLENLAAGKGGEASLARAAEATQTGFEPKGKAEKAAAVVGDVVGNAPLGAAIAAPVAAVLPEAAGLGYAGLAARGAAEGAAVGGGFQAVNDVAETGKTSAKNIGKGALIGGGIGAAASPLAAAVARRLAARAAAKFRADQFAESLDRRAAEAAAQGDLRSKPTFMRETAPGQLSDDLRTRYDMEHDQVGADAFDRLARAEAAQRAREQFLNVREQPLGPAAPFGQDVPPALPSPEAPRQLGYEQPVQGDGFTMSPSRERNVRVYLPQVGEDVNVPESDLARAAQRRLGVVKPQDVKLRPDLPQETAPVPKVSKGEVRGLLREGDAVYHDQGKLDRLVTAAKQGQLNQAQLKSVVNGANSWYRIFAKRRGLNAPETEAVGQALEKLGFTRPTIEPAAPEVGLEQPPFAQEAPKAPVSPLPDNNPPAEVAQTPVAAREVAPGNSPRTLDEDLPPWVTEHEVPADEKAKWLSQFEEQAALDMGNGTKTPVTEAVIRSGGLSREAGARNGYLGKGMDYKGRPGVFAKEGAADWDQLATDLSREGILPENASGHDLVEALRYEADNGRPLHQVLAPELRRGQGGYVRFGAQPGQPVDPPELAAYKAKIKENPEAPKRTLKQTFDGWFSKLVDATDPIKQAEKKGGGSGKFGDALNRYLGVGETVKQRLERGTFKVIDGKMTKTGEGLQKVLQDFDNEFFRQHGDTALDDLRAFMLAERDLELATRDIHGVSPENAQATLDFLNTKYQGKLSDFAERIRGWQDRAILEPLLDSGILSEEQVLQIKMANEKHVPFDRVMDEVDPGGANFETGSPVKEIKGSEREVYDPFQKMIGNAYRAAQAAERNNVYRSVVDLRNLTPDLAEALKPANKSMGDTITVYNNGEAEFYHAPKEFREALNNLHTQDIGPLGRFLSIFARAQRAGITQHPRFSLYRNPVRDQITAFMNAKYGFTPGIDYAKGFFELFNKGEFYEEWAAAGGGNSTVVAMDRASAQVSLRKLRGLRELDSLSPISWLQHLSETMENSTRLGVYKRARLSGAAIDEAITEAKEVTVNFGLHGSDPTFQKMNAVTAFQRPAVLSSARFFRQLAQKPGQTMVRGFTGLTMPSLALWYVNKDNRDYQEQPAWKKNTFWFIPVGQKKDGSTRFIEVPKPFEYGVLFGSLPERVADHIYRKDPKAVEDWFSSMRNSMDVPVVPTVLKPIVDTAADYNSYTGRSIVPKSRANMMPADQYGDYTPEVAKAAGRALGASPAKIDYFVQGYTGTAGKMGEEIADNALAKFGGKSIPKPAVPGEEAIFGRAPIGSNSESVARFYDYKNKMERQLNSQAMHAGIEPSELVTDDLLEFRDAAEQIHEMQTANQQIAASPRMPPESKRTLIDKNNRIITNIARSVVGTFERRLSKPSTGRQ